MEVIFGSLGRSGAPVKRVTGRRIGTLAKTWAITPAGTLYFCLCVVICCHLLHD